MGMHFAHCCEVAVFTLLRCRARRERTGATTGRLISAMLNQQLELFLVARSRRSPAGSMPSVAMIRSLRIPREALVNQRTQAINQLRALIVTAPAELRESLAGLTAKQLIERVAHFRVGSVTSPAEASRFAMRQLGRHVLHIDVQVEDLDRQLDPLVAGRAPELLAIYGVGVEVASNLLVAWDNAHRIRSEAAFASLCGVAPVPASSGKTSRHRLSRGGDRIAKPRPLANRPDADADG